MRISKTQHERILFRVMAGGLSAAYRLVAFVCFVVFVSQARVTSAESKCFPFGANPADRTTYGRYVNGLWNIYPCPPGTRWKDVECACANVPGVHCRHLGNLVAGGTNRMTITCRNKHPGLAWSDTLCRCVWVKKPTYIEPKYDPSRCEVVLHLAFDSKPPQESNRIYIKATRPRSIQLITDYDALDWVATYLPHAPLVVPGLLGNDLSQSFHINVRFRVENSPSINNKFVIIYTNGCRQHADTLSLLYRPVDQSYRVKYISRTGSNELLDCTYHAGSGYAWKTAIVVLQDERLFLFVNNKPCGIPALADVGMIGKFKCPLTIGGGLHTTDETSFIGFMDNMLIMRRCKIAIPYYGK